MTPLDLAAAQAADVLDAVARAPERSTYLLLHAQAAVCGLELLQAGEPGLVWELTPQGELRRTA